MDSERPEAAEADVPSAIAVNLDIMPEDAASPCKDAAGASAVEKGKLSPGLKRAACILLPSSMALAALVLLIFNGGSLKALWKKPLHGTPHGIHGEPLAAIRDQAKGLVTEAYIVDDIDAKNNGQKHMLAAVAGQAPYFHKWFGSSTTKAFHHDGGNPSSLQISVSGMYEPQLQASGCYEVHEWHPTGPWSQMSLSASVDVVHAHGIARMLVDQRKQGGQWNYLASFNFEKGAAQVVLSNHQSRCTGPSPCYTTFDAFRFVHIAPECSSQQNAYAAAVVATASESEVHIFNSSIIQAGTKDHDTLPNQAPQSEPETGTRDHDSVSNSPSQSEPSHHTSPTSPPQSEPSCMAATIINDFDSHLVKSIVLPHAKDLPDEGLEAFRPGRVGEKPFFHDWFGDILKKDFHHDAHINKGLLQVNYTAPLSEAGCYLLQEWHLGGNRYCVNYMPRRVPFHVHGIGSTQTTYADQSTNGGQWNTLGLFQFSTSATIVMDNAGTNDCLYQGQCYTVFDSIRLVHVGDECQDVDHGEDALSRMSDLACDEPNSLAQLRTVPGQKDADPSTAEASPVKLLEITSPSERSVTTPGESVAVFWQTEGVASGTDLKISLLYNDEILVDAQHRTSASAESMHLPIPNAQYIKEYSDAVAGGNNRFRIRIDVQHVVVDLSNGWSNQLYANSPYFSIDL